MEPGFLRPDVHDTRLPEGKHLILAPSLRLPHQCSLSSPLSYPCLTRSRHEVRRSVTAIRVTLYVSGDESTSVECYNPATCKWMKVAPMPMGRASHGYAIWGDSIIVWGGYVYNLAYSCDIYDPRTLGSVAPSLCQCKWLALPCVEARDYAYDLTYAGSA